MDSISSAEINKLISVLRGMGRDLNSRIKDDLKDSAKLVVSAIKGRTPVGTKIHKRYVRLSAGRKKAAKGQGRVIATYRPGNLKRSFRILGLRRAKNALFVGPLLRGKVTDGYYAHHVNNGVTFKNGKTIQGKRFVEQAVSTISPVAVRLIIRNLNDRITSYISKSGSFASRYARAKGRE